MPNGAQALMKTLVDAGIEVCFSNPGTSEMHFVAALDNEPKMRAVLALFEGVATGAADGYARMAGKPAATLLHLGCGLGNGLANLHNARKGKSPMINIVGDHATYHVKYDAQLQSDIETVARNVSPNFVRTSQRTEELCKDAAEAITAARGLPGQVATLILPADVSWGEGGQACTVPEQKPAPCADSSTIESISEAINSDKKTALLLGGQALREAGLLAAGKIAAAKGVTLFAETFPSRIERGAGLPAVERIAYLAEMASLQLSEFDHLILVDAKAPVSFFAYPGKQSYLVPDSCTVHTLSSEEQDAIASLTQLAESLGADSTQAILQSPGRPGRPKGKLSAEKVCRAVGELMPENSIIVDESITSGLMLNAMTAGAPRHDMITLTGGAIGQGLPSAIGAAIACPDRPVLALIGDGTAMYTNQALWTMARENLNVTAIIFNNASYSVLNVELERVGAEEAGEKAKSQLDISRPVTNFALLAQSMGVHGTRVQTSEELLKAMEYSLSQPGPHLIEAVVPESLNGVKRKILPYLLKSMPNLPAPLSKALKNKIAP
ncbi:acetolactate synthase large subunit [Pseudoteredinibacter isoporae]|uniref:Acetolactate synthase-1/2/3 large subunit n=1 Tax=Pseudoteredinibacter isoporae TaxID=570281 RepID=A0A7X0JU10_9GAMM|nr:acetolactate synthase large subunit [Pseudoteredinibacter isoporae]MBB6522234.1 acetolactate synthase-1/2/3 large subunit [Pseudoteredinibacter isoporae]NHO87768.1 acetolactate synthase large subunit [Pseudoteredinibacter isoporae]NIB23901.1 acetolactate synthase large subunit [Pseudoteredinibacter isoporae]